jgi:hypothetical protein
MDWPFHPPDSGERNDYRRSKPAQRGRRRSWRSVAATNRGYGSYVWVTGTTIGFLALEPKGSGTAEQPGRRDDLDAHRPGTVIKLTSETAARVGTYPEVGRPRSRGDSAATMTERASPDKRKGIAQNPADESSDTERFKDERIDSPDRGPRRAIPEPRA